MAIIIGGVARLSGAVTGAVILVGLTESLRFMRGLVPGISETDMASLQLGVFGLLLILFMRWRPQGVFGTKEAS